MLTRSNYTFCFSSDHFYIILPTITDIGNREVFCRSGKITVNTVTLNSFYNVSILWKRDVYPSNVWFITVIAFSGVGRLRNSYFKISSDALSSLVSNIWKFIFIRFGSFSMFIEWYCIKRPFSSSLCSFLIILLSDSDFWTVFCEGLLWAWFCCYQTEKVCGSRCFGLKRNWNKRDSFLNSIRGRYKYSK